MSLSASDLKESIALIDGLSFEATDKQYANLAAVLHATNTSHMDGYQNAWAEQAQRIEDLVSRDLALLDVVGAAEGRFMMDGILPKFITVQVPHVDISGWPDAPDHQVVVRDDRYALVRCADVRVPLLIDYLARLVTPETNAIIELGCGWGRNLVRLAQRLGRSDITYIGCEQSDAGRHITARLLAHDPSVRYATHDFDFYALDYRPDEAFDEVLVFTSAALEQITFTPPDLLRYAAGLGKRVRIALFEPFGWQRVDGLRPSVPRQCILEMYGHAPSTVKGTHVFHVRDQNVDLNAAAWSVICKYNMNLYSLIQRAEADGMALKQLAFNVWGPNPFNPYSLAVLESP